VLLDLLWRGPKYPPANGLKLPGPRRKAARRQQAGDWSLGRHPCSWRRESTRSPLPAVARAWPRTTSSACMRFGPPCWRVPRSPARALSVAPDAESSHAGRRRLRDRGCPIPTARPRAARLLLWCRQHPGSRLAPGATSSIAKLPPTSCAVSAQTASVGKPPRSCAARRMQGSCRAYLAATGALIERDPDLRHKTPGQDRGRHRGDQKHRSCHCYRGRGSHVVRSSRSWQREIRALTPPPRRGTRRPPVRLRVSSPGPPGRDVRGAGADAV
jgi:hypothetical protein